MMKDNQILLRIIGIISLPYGLQEVSLSSGFSSYVPFRNDIINRGLSFATFGGDYGGGFGGGDGDDGRV